MRPLMPCATLRQPGERCTMFMAFIEASRTHALKHLEKDLGRGSHRLNTRVESLRSYARKSWPSILKEPLGASHSRHIPFFDSLRRAAAICHQGDTCTFLKQNRLQLVPRQGPSATAWSENARSRQGCVQAFLLEGSRPQLDKV